LTNQSFYITAHLLHLIVFYLILPTAFAVHILTVHFINWIS